MCQFHKPKLPQGNKTKSQVTPAHAVSCFTREFQEHEPCNGQQANLPRLDSSGKHIFFNTIGKPDFALEGDSISIFQAVCYANIFEKIVQNKGQLVPPLIRHVET